MNELIKKRRSVRRYEERAVEPEKIETLLRAAMQAPSAKNQQPWEFIVVTDKEKRESISKMSPYSGFAADAPVLIITLCDLDRADQFNWWVSDMAACTENILLQAVEEGLGACWCGFYPYADRVEPLKELFDLPRNIMPFSIVTLGYPARESRIVDRFEPARVHYEKY